MKKIKIIIILLAAIASSPSWTDEKPEVQKENYTYEDISNIQNDKEVQSTIVNKEEISRLQKLFPNIQENTKIIDVFKNNLYFFLNTQDAHCELKYIAELMHDFQKNNIKTSKNEILDIFKMLRLNNIIDDIYYEVLENLVIDYYLIPNIDLETSPQKNIFKNYNKVSEGYNVNELFDSFKAYPNEITSCSYVEFFKIRGQIGNINDSINKRNSKLKDLAFVAFTNNIISKESYNKIKFLTDKSAIQKRSIWLNDYFKIIFSAKNKMIPFKRSYKPINLSVENTYSTDRASRYNKMTKRKLLYAKYDENQIVLLSQVMKKASQRMGVDPDTKTGIPYLIEEYKTSKQNGETDNYVEKIELDTQDQFNLARKLLHRDMVNLQMMKSFQNVKITYEDLVMASLETGYLSLDDIDYVVKYDDLWNPKTTKTERLLKWTFRIAGYGTFFLPPPWNVTGALTLAIVEGIADKKIINGTNNENPNTIID